MVVIAVLVTVVATPHFTVPVVASATVKVICKSSKFQCLQCMAFWFHTRDTNTRDTKASILLALHISKSNNNSTPLSTGDDLLLTHTNKFAIAIAASLSFIIIMIR